MSVLPDGSVEVPSKRKSMKTNRPTTKPAAGKRGTAAAKTKSISRSSPAGRGQRSTTHAVTGRNGTVALTKRSAGARDTAATSAPRILGMAAVEAPLVVLSDEDLRKVKTGLTRRDLDRYRKLLLDKRHEILGDVESLQTDRTNKNSGGNLSNMPLHMADVGSDNYEQEFTLHLVESERKLLREIDAALTRIKGGTFGVCVERGVPISKARIDAKPWAKYCIEVTRERERMGQSAD
jgi:DnaK suppressor protein